LECRSHGRLEVDGTNVLPLLLEKRSEEIAGKLGVYNNFLLGHGYVSNSNVEAHNLLHLELDSRLDLVDLFLHVLSTGKKGWELTSLGETGSEKTRDLLDHVVGSKEEIVSLGKLLNKLLVLVKLLQVFHAHVVNTNTIGLFTMGGVSKHAALETRARDGWKTEGSGETLVTLRIVVLQRDLNFEGLGEFTDLSLEFFTSLGDGLSLGEGKGIGDALIQKL